jgi:hypothetical protein
MVDDGMMLMGQCFLKTGFSFSSLSQTHLSCKPGVLNLFRLGTTFTAAYKLAGDKAINKDNLLKLLNNLLKMLLMYYYKHIHILLNNFHLKKLVTSEISGLSLVSEMFQYQVEFLLLHITRISPCVHQ